MELEYDYWTGFPKDVQESLSRSMGQYKLHYKKIKIGITNKPERRKTEHEINRPKWTKMVVKYESNSNKFTKGLEKFLVDKNWDYIENEISGGGGPNGKGKQYLYVLLRGKK